MAIKNYYAVNGRIRGESTVAGGHRSYGLDALGSVVATYDGTGALENTYRTAPYGTPVQKTGTAADPRFLWNGGSGYRTTLRSYSPYYVRARHLDYLTTRWTTVDPLWPDASSYGYANARPVKILDISGRKPTGGVTGWGLTAAPFFCTTPTSVDLSAGAPDVSGGNVLALINANVQFGTTCISGSTAYARIQYFEQYYTTGTIYTPKPEPKQKCWYPSGNSFYTGPNGFQVAQQIGAPDPCPTGSGYWTNGGQTVDKVTFSVNSPSGTPYAGSTCICQIMGVIDTCKVPPATAPDPKKGIGTASIYINLSNGKLVTDQAGSDACTSYCKGLSWPTASNTCQQQRS